jgi:hypothetical protein
MQRVDGALGVLLLAQMAGFGMETLASGRFGLLFGVSFG